MFLRIVNFISSLKFPLNFFSLGEHKKKAQTLSRRNFIVVNSQFCFIFSLRNKKELIYDGNTRERKIKTERKGTEKETFLTTSSLVLSSRTFLWPFNYLHQHSSNSKLLFFVCLFSCHFENLFLLFSSFYFHLLSDKTPHELTSFHPCLLRAHVRLRAPMAFRRFKSRSDGTGPATKILFLPNKKRRFSWRGKVWREFSSRCENDGRLVGTDSTISSQHRAGDAKVLSLQPNERTEKSLRAEKRTDMATASTGAHCAISLSSMDSNYIEKPQMCWRGKVLSPTLQVGMQSKQLLRRNFSIFTRARERMKGEIPSHRRGFEWCLIWSHWNWFFDTNALSRSKSFEPSWRFSQISIKFQL